jgi:2-oxoglutarate ferredoxin oxidoreductase subunit alpha
MSDPGEDRRRYIRKMEGTTHFILGDEACAYGAIFAGLDFFAGYPITPASEVAELLARELPRAGGICIQMEDELASMAAIVGASWTGARTLTATSGPGFSLMQENIGYAVMTETPCVVVNVQRSGPSTGQATKPAQGDVMQARWGTHGDHDIVALAPNSVQECFDLMFRSFDLADVYRTPVIVLMDGEIGHIRESVTFPRLDSIHYASRKKADGMRDVSTQEIHDVLVRRLCRKIEEGREDIVMVEQDRTPGGGARIGVLSHGASSRPAMGAVHAARQEGRKIDFLRLITLWPFARRQVQEFAEGMDAILVPEMNLGQMAREVERFVSCPVVPVPKIGGIPHTVDEIAGAIREVM